MEENNYFNRIIIVFLVNITGARRRAACVPLRKKRDKGG
jgi:hypothetical protein